MEAVHQPAMVFTFCLLDEDRIPRLLLRDDQWEQIESLLQGKAGDRGRTGSPAVPNVTVMSNGSISRAISTGRRPRTRNCIWSATTFATHNHPKVKEWLEKHPRFHGHFSPTSSSWLNMVERLFRSISTDRLEHEVFRSVPELISAMEECIAMHNQNPTPNV
jgi:hypothetical protein